jgi:hypothetical protein
MTQLLGLIEEVLEARTGVPAQNPALRPLEETPDPKVTQVADDQLLEFLGEWPFPPPSEGEEARTTLRITLGEGHLVARHPTRGTFKLYLQPDGSFHMEDALQRIVPVRNPDGSLAGFAEERSSGEGRPL